MSGRWTISAGRNIYFDGKPFISVDREGDTEPVEADGSVHFIVDCLNRANVTPDDIWARHMGHPRRKPKHVRESAGEDQADAGFAISVSDQRSIEDAAMEKFGPRWGEKEDRDRAMKDGLVTADGQITQAGWDLLGDDIGKLEDNSMKWLRKTFHNAQDQGHDRYDDLVGAVWFDPSDPEQAWLISLASPSPGGSERIDMTDLSYGDLADSVWTGVSWFGGLILGGQVTFFDVKPEDMETIEDTLEKARQRERGRRKK